MCEPCLSTLAESETRFEYPNRVKQSPLEELGLSYETSCIAHRDNKLNMLTCAAAGLGFRA